MKLIELKYSLPILDAEGKPTKDVEGNKAFAQYIVLMNVPEDYTELGQIYGEAVSYVKAMAQIIIDARRLCYNAKDNADAQETINKWTPGVSMARAGGVSKKEAVELLRDFTEDEVLAMVEEIKRKRGEA